MGSDRRAIADGLVSMLEGLADPDTSNPLYTYVQGGNVQDPSAFKDKLWGSVQYYRGLSKPAGSGGNMIGWRIEDNPIFILLSGLQYTSATAAAAHSQMMHTMDVVNEAIHSHYQIPSALNPSQPIGSVYSLLTGGSNDSLVVKRMVNNASYYLWFSAVTVKQQYNVQLATPY